MPGVDAEMDRYANDMIERFRDLMPATWLDASGEGLFVDGGAGGTTGLAGRIEVNAAVDPGAGGAVWRLRDGLSAATPGAEGDGTNLQALSDAMSAARQPIGFVSQNANAGGALMASEIASFLAGRSARSDENKAYLTARQSSLIEAGDRGDRGGHRRPALLADAGRADLRRQRPRPLGDRRADEASPGVSDPCA